MEKKKIFVLDTNVLLHDPMSLYGFPNCLIGIPIQVLEELDAFKKESSDRGKNARDISRRLDELRTKGSLSEGVKLENHATIKVLFRPENCPTGWPLEERSTDNRILYTAYCLKKSGQEVRFISKDINARIKADVLGIDAQDYLKGRVQEDQFYKGWIDVDVASVVLKKDNPQELQDVVEQYDIEPNQYIWLKANNNPHNYKVWRYLGGKSFRTVLAPKLHWQLSPRNPQQLMAMDALLDPSIQLVSLLGPAGTGKTFLALLAGLHQVLVQDEYEKMLISRPVIPLGPDIGYLPGDIQEKLHSWMQPIFDNMDFITHSVQQQAHIASIAAPLKSEHGDKRHKFGKRETHGVGLRPLDQMIRDHKVSLEAITYMRGRSIPFQYILIDEVQNLSPHEVKTIISRVGQGSKIVLCGDPYQIDSPYLDFASNGLVVASNKFKGQSLAATIYLSTSERSELSRLAAELL